MRLPADYLSDGNPTMDIETLIRSIPDYPKAGVIFRDITTLLQHPAGFRKTIDDLVQPFAGNQIGFILGGAVAHQLSVGFIAVRKKGKLPWQTISKRYDLEYGTDEVEIHTDSVRSGDRVLVVDDLIATGGTACATVALLRDAGALVIGASFVIDLPDLGGKEKLEAMDVPTRTLIAFEGD